MELKKFAEQYNVILDDTALERFALYAEELTQWNEKINLTAIKDREGIYLKHFADSLSIFSAIEFPQGAKVIDVGTGAGFPGVAMKIARPDLNIYLLDSTQKKLNVIDDILQKLDLKATTIHARAEELQKQEGFGASFDFAVARAVADLKKLSGWCVPFVKPGGHFVAMKGAKADEEIKNAEKKIKQLGGKIETVKHFELADAGERNIVVIGI